MKTTFIRPKRPRVTRVLPNSGKLKIANTDAKTGNLLTALHSPKFTMLCM